MQNTDLICSSRSFCGILFLTLLAINCFSQSTQIYHAPNMLPPSPTASALGKYGLVPISLSIGTPNVDIPLHTFKTRNLSLPISISYHSSGVKLSEAASWVGIGWSLNSGGVVNRIIRDEPDEVGAVPLPYPGFFGATDPATLDYIDYVGNNEGADTEPDLYTYNFLGYTGKFVYDRNGVPVLMPAGNLKIEKPADSLGVKYFVITTPEGIKCTFNAIETSSSPATNYEKGYTIESPTAWYMTKIQHPLGDVIKLSYVTYSYFFASGMSQSFVRNIAIMACGSTNVCPDPPDALPTANSQFVRGKRLVKIEAVNFGAVEFDATRDRPDLDDYKLNRLIVKDRNDLPMKEIDFVYSFPNGHRMFLKSLVEKGKSGTKEKTHHFDYDDPEALPKRLSPAQDHWGYYNGATSNTDFVPKNLVIKNVDGNLAFAGVGGNREPNSTFAKKGLLKKITYPTAGTSEFFYEANTYYGDKTINPQPTHIQLSCNGGQGTPPVSQSQQITSPIRQVIEYTFSVGLLSGNSNPGIGGQLNIQSGSNIVSIPLNAGQHYKGYFEVFPNQTCTFTVVAKAPAISSFVYFDYYAIAPYTIQDNVETGGLRVSKVINHDPFTNKDEITSYYYAKHDQLTHSSGQPTDAPNYYSFYKTRTSCLQHCAFYECTFGVLSANTKNSLFQMNGSNIHYQYVTIVKGPDMSQGAEEHEFTIHFDQVPQQVWGSSPLNNVPLTNSGWNNGMEKYIRYYRKDGASYTLIKQIYNSFVQDTRKYVEVPSLVVRKKYYIECIENNRMDFLDAIEYKNISYWIYLDKTTEITYHEQGSDTIEIDYTYDNPEHRLQTRVTMHDSEGKMLETSTKYPGDYFTTTSSALQSLADKHIINVPIRQESIVNGDLYNGEVIIYNANGQPINVYRYESPILKAPTAHDPAIIVPSNDYKLKTTLEYESATNHLKRIQPADNFNTSYLWGYNNTLPIAEVRNAVAGNVYYTSFEDSGITSSDARTGTKVWEGTYQMTLTNFNGNYRLSYWKKTGSGPWELVEQTVSVFPAMPNVTIGSAGSYIDDVRVHPPKAMMTTYTYDPLVGVTSVTDFNQVTTWFIYDDFGRLSVAKDSGGNIVKAYEYHYKE